MCFVVQSSECGPYAECVGLCSALPEELGANQVTRDLVSFRIVPGNSWAVAVGASVVTCASPKFGSSGVYVTFWLLVLLRSVEILGYTCNSEANHDWFQTPN